MKLKAVSASLAAVLTATLFISLLPPAQAQSAPAQTQQPANSTKPRRGKNGEPVTKTAENSDTTQDEDTPQDSKPETSKPETSKPVPPAQSSAQTGSQKPAGTGDKAAAASGNKPTQGSGQTGSGPAGKPAAPQIGSPQERDAPPFDRPPVGAQGSSGASSGRSPDSSRPSRQQPSYSDSDAARRSDSRGQSSSRTSTSTSSDVDPEPTGRAGGRPPVLQRPADSRSDGDGNSSGDRRAPVLHRPNDPQPRDEGDSPEISSGRRPQSGQQQSGAQQQSGGDNDVIKLESTLINIPLLVSDRSGRYVPQLSARDFALYEDGVEQKIASFGTEEVPFSVVLLLDVSPSVQGNAKDIQDAAIAFVRQLRDQDRVMVVSFDRNIHYLSEFTSDRRELESAIRRANIGSGTSVYDAVYETVQRKLRNIDGRKALILFSDGEDTTSSRASYDDAVNMVTESDVLVYGLRYPGNGGGHASGRGNRGNSWPRSPIPGVRIPLPFPFPWPRPRGPFTLSGWAATGNSAVPSPDPQWSRRRGGGNAGDFMADITAAGGGPVYDAEKVGDMSTVAHRIAEELRHVYVISYYPSNPLSNGGYRAVRVSVRGRDDIAVRHRRGYNAKPNGSGKPTI